MQKRIDELFKVWHDPTGAGAQVLVIHKGEVVFEKCYGCANIETQTPMTTDSLFHVSSTTKPFTAMSILILQERGLLNINDDVRRYIPDMIRFSEPLTIKQMLNHVSGVRGYYELMYLGGRSGEDHYAQHEIRRLIARQKVLNFTPGSEFLYTNANFMLCATIVERVSGLTFPEFVRENILRPLGMEHSFIRDNPRCIIPNKASSYHDDGYEYTNGILTFGIYGGTSLHTNCRELARFVHEFMEPTLISRQTMDSIMLNPPVIGEKRSHYGTGIMIGDLEGHRYIHHGGSNAGYRSSFQAYPEDDLMVLILTNTYTLPVEDAAWDITRIVLGLPPRVFKTLDEFYTDEPLPEDLDGTYCNQRNGKFYDLAVRDGKLYMDGVCLTQVRGNIYKQGRRPIWISVGSKVYRTGGNAIAELKKIGQDMDPATMEQYLGEYYCDDAQSHFEIGAGNDTLLVKHLRFRPRKLLWLGGDDFRYDEYKIHFTRDAQGAVNGYLFSSPHLRNVEFVKVK